MTDVNRILAEKVMGWHKGQIRNHPSNLWWWMNDKEQTEIPVINWQPDTNIEQAFMCEEKLDVQQKLWYIAHLRELMRERCTKNGITNASMQNYEMVHASAKERCHALLEAVKGEKE